MFAVVRKAFGQALHRKFEPSFDPYRYTRGRWLDRDAERRRARHLRFNFDSLLDLAVKCSPGARRVIDCEKKEGGFNRVFVVHLDNGKTVIARLPNRIAGPSGLSMSSEVATIQYVREKTKVPVPTVLSWSSTTDNAIGAEYMIMETMPVVMLKDMWNSMTASQHILCIQSIGKLNGKLSDLEFPNYGSLYFNNDKPQSAISLDDTFCIGPLCGRDHWDYDDKKLLNTEKSIGGDKGPWPTLDDYLSGLVAKAKSSTKADNRTTNKPTKTCTKSHQELLDIAQETMKLLTSPDIIKEGGNPTLFHPDFHTRNILVDPEDPTIVTGIIDWQSAAIEPAFVFSSNTPDFASELPDVSFYGTRNEETNDDKTRTDDIPTKETRAEETRTEQTATNETPTKETHTDETHTTEPPNDEVKKLSPREKLEVDVEFCRKAWAVMHYINPKLRDAYALAPQIETLLSAGSASYLSDPVVLRSILTNLAHSWDELGLPGQSLYQPNSAEREALEEQLDEARTTHRLSQHLAMYLGCDMDGWVPTERWDEVLPLYRSEYQRCVASCRDSGLDEAAAVVRADQLWPYDLR